MQFLNERGELVPLNIPENEQEKRFACPSMKQSDLIGRSFWILNAFSDCGTKYGENKSIFKIKFDLDDAESEARKVWTGCPDIIYALKWMKENDKFPCKVTLQRSEGGKFILE